VSSEDKALKVGKISASGSFLLFIGKLVSTIVLAVGTIILGIFISDADYGLYAIALVPAATMLLFQDFGVTSALTRFCAQSRALGNESELRRIIKTGLYFQTATGLALTLLCFLIANFVAGSIFGKPESALLIVFSSSSIFFSSLMVVSQSVFIGFDRMDLSSYTMIFQAAIQAVLVPLLVYLGHGAAGAIIGYTVSFLFSGVISVVLLLSQIYSKTTNHTPSNLGMSKELRLLLGFGIPLATATILSGLLTQLYSFIMASTVDNAIIGNFRIAMNFAVLPTLLTVPISTTLFPAFSKLNPKTERPLLRSVFASSVKYAILFLIPSTIALMVLGQPLIATLYGGKWLYSPLYLSLYVASNLFTVFGSLSLQSLFTALGETKLLMKISLAVLLLGVPLGFFLIPQFGIVGMIVAVLITGFLNNSICAFLGWKRYRVKPDLSASTKIFIASIVAGAVSYLLLTTLKTAFWMQLTIGIILFVATYLVVLPFIGAITEADITNLKALLTNSMMAKLLSIPLTIIEKLLRVRKYFLNLMCPF
jgi:O-antigen/teichoic acid export membrane protein